MFGNVRGGSWFLHHDRYEKQNKALIEWMEKHRHSNVVIIEIGAGYNTPTVTRFPMEAYAKETNSRLIRINPSDPEVPEDLSALAFAEGWQVLDDISKSTGNIKKGVEMETEVLKSQHEMDLVVPKQVALHYRRHFGRFDWRSFLKQLRDHHR